MDSLEKLRLWRQGKLVATTDEVRRRLRSLILASVLFFGNLINATNELLIFIPSVYAISILKNIWPTIKDIYFFLLSFKVNKKTSSKRKVDKNNHTSTWMLQGRSRKGNHSRWSESSWAWERVPRRIEPWEADAALSLQCACRWHSRRPHALLAPWRPW